MAANAEAALADFGIGAAIVALLSSYMQVNISFFDLFLGGVLALLPDIDVIHPIWKKVRGKKIGEHHASLMHRPLIVVPVTTALCYVVGGDFWALAGFLCVTAHYIHDTPPLGDAHLNWWWPLGGKDITPSGEHWEWIKKKWLQPHPRSVCEIATGTILLAVALNIAGHKILAILVMFFIWGIVLTIWAIASTTKFDL